MLRRAFLKALAIIGVATVTPAVPDDKLTEEQFNEFLEMGFQYGNSKKYLLLSPKTIARYGPIAEKAGVKVLLH